jgi:hypothetical protein
MLLFLGKQALRNALAEARLCSKMESIALKKKTISTGDSSEVHSQKVSISLSIAIFLDRGNVTCVLQNVKI